MNWRTKPAILTAQMVAWLLGLHFDGVMLLARLGTLPSLGKPKAGACWLFAASKVEELASDEKWLAKAVNQVRRHVAEKNLRARNRHPSETQHQPAP